MGTSLTAGVPLKEKERARQHGEHSGDFVGRFYYRQAPTLLRRALPKPIDRAKYEPLSPPTRLRPHRPPMVETGVLDKPIAFEEFRRHEVRGGEEGDDAVEA